MSMVRDAVSTTDIAAHRKGIALTVTPADCGGGSLTVASGGAGHGSTFSIVPPPGTHA
jgi:hypothetical protein